MVRRLVPIAGVVLALAIAFAPSAAALLPATPALPQRVAISAGTTAGATLGSSTPFCIYDVGTLIQTAQADGTFLLEGRLMDGGTTLTHAAPEAACPDVARTFTLPSDPWGAALASPGTPAKVTERPPEVCGGSIQSTFLATTDANGQSSLSFTRTYLTTCPLSYEIFLLNAGRTLSP